MLAFYFLFMFIWMFIVTLSDVFKRDDLSGWAKAGWIVLLFWLPLIGVLVVRDHEAGEPRGASRSGRELMRATRRWGRSGSRTTSKGESWAIN